MVDNKTISSNKTGKKKIKGQFYMSFLTMVIPIFILMMIVVIDYSNFLNVRNMARALADSTALAAAGAVDMGGADGKSGGTNKGHSYTLDPSWARARAQQVFNQTLNADQPRYMRTGRTEFLMDIQIVGKEASVTITATYKPIWSNLLGAKPMTTVAISKATAATGIGGPV